MICSNPIGGMEGRSPPYLFHRTGFAGSRTIFEEASLPAGTKTATLRILRPEISAEISVKSAKAPDSNESQIHLNRFIIFFPVPYLRVFRAVRAWGRPQVFPQVWARGLPWAWERASPPGRAWERVPVSERPRVWVWERGRHAEALCRPRVWALRP